MLCVHSNKNSDYELSRLRSILKVYLALLAHFALNRMPQVIFSWDEKIKLTHSSCL